MITADMIPDEVIWKLHDKLWAVGGPSVDEVRAAIAAAFNAWPGGAFNKGYKVTEICGDYIILPLPQKENTNEG